MFISKSQSRALIILLAVALMGTFTGCGEDTPDEPEPTNEELDLWDQAHKERASGKADNPACSGVIVPDRPGFDGKIALTFDDGPSPSTTPKVLDILAAHGVKATFFVTGKQLGSEERRAIAQRMLEEGHIVANHTYDHPNMRTLSAAAADTQIAKTHERLVELGVEPRFFRFPYGSTSCATADAVRGYGYSITGWHVDSADWCFASRTGGVGHCATSTFRHVPSRFRDDMVGYTVHQTKQNDGGVLLFHDVHSNTVNNLDMIITRLKESGFTFTNLDDMETFPKLNGDNTPPPFVGDACAEDADCDFSSGHAEGFCHKWSSADGTEAYGFCSLMCEGTCPDASGKATTFCVTLDQGETGQCVSKAHTMNQECDAMPGTAAKDADRFVGGSSASPTTSTVCLPTE